jgi:hyperosmotically inducible protein
MPQSYLHFCLVCVISLLALSPAYAITPDVNEQSGYNREFRFLDKDGNSKLSWGEARKDKMLTRAGFAKADSNRNQTLDQEEFSFFKATEQQKLAKQVASDSAITAKIKSKYLVEKNFRSFKVSVETNNGVVILSGFVENEFSRKRAQQMAYEVDGVKAVKNALIVKP